jgi:uroporphyrin-III C-methyltransferase
MDGKVYLVGAGPGDPELLTLKALKVLQTADVVLHDDLISSEILELVPKTAHVRNVGKRCGRKSIHQVEINALLVSFASFGLKVVRLKSGDPLLFGRAGEELEALRKANVEVEIVPGVTSAMASAASLGASLTQRGKASAVVFLTSHQATSGPGAEWQKYVSSGATLAIYMPGFDYQQTADKLVSAGLRGDTPCAVVSKASSKDEKIHRTTVRNLPNAPKFPAPTLLLVGDVVRPCDWFQPADAAPHALNPQATYFPPTALDVFVDNQVFWGD